MINMELRNSGTQELRKGNAEPNRQLGGKHAQEKDDLSTETVCLGAWSEISRFSHSSHTLLQSHSFPEFLSSRFILSSSPFFRVLQ
jgi:hypothetical protein